jgi:hypothetical protein
VLGGGGIGSKFKEKLNLRVVVLWNKKEVKKEVLNH